MKDQRHKQIAGRRKWRSNQNLDLMADIPLLHRINISVSI